MRHLEKIPFLLEGIWLCFKTSSGFRLHLGADIATFILAVWLGIPVWGWVFLVVMTVLKASFELVNSAIEEIAEELWPRENGTSPRPKPEEEDFHPTAKLVKDYAGAAEFVAILGSGAVWGILFIPEFTSIVTGWL